MKSRIISTKTYIVLAVVFVAALGCAYFLRENEISKSLATMPAIGSLVAAIYQTLKDQAAFERQDYLQRQQQIFNLGTTSHMANVAFDKHAKFCEDYMSEVHDTVADLFRLGPRSSRVIDEHLKKLISLKKKYAAWVPKDVAQQLEPFESAINMISAQAVLVEDYGEDAGKERAHAVKAMHEIYRSLLKREERGVEKDDQEVSAEDIKEKLRMILGINELTKMRKLLVDGAIKFLEDS